MTIDRKTAPFINDITSFNLVKAKKTQLPNGINLNIINSGEGELVKIEWMFAAGGWYQSAPLVAFTVNNTLVDGTSKLSSKQIAESVEFYGATLGYNVDKDNAFVSVVTLRKHLPYILEIMANILKNAAFPDQEIDIFIQKHRQQFLIEQEKVGSVARNTHARIMYGNSHPYGVQILEHSFSEVVPSLLRTFYSRNYCTEKCRIIMSGRVEDSEIRLIEKFFGSDHWGNYLFNNSITAGVEPEYTNNVFVEKEGAVQNAIRIGKIVGNKLNPDYPGLSVLNCILGGYFGSRLMKKIREEKGYTYGINSLLVTLVNSGFLTIVTEVGSDFTRPALDDIYAEINKLRNELVPIEELGRVKNYMLGELVRMFDGPFAQAESLISLLEYDLDYSYYDNIIKEIRNITRERIIELAVRYLDPASMTQVVVGRPF
jgi:predicted Zn-dependent peptidase